MKKKQGFAGQRIIEINDEAAKMHQRKHSTGKLGFFSKVGFFPEAKYQFLEDRVGSADYALVYCVKGYGTAIINHKILHVSPGDFFVIPANTPFSYAADQIKPWTIFWFFFDGEAIREMADLFIHNAGSYKGYLPYTDERIKLFNRIYKCLEQGHGEQNLLMLNMCLLNLISSLVLLGGDRVKISDKQQLLVNSSIQFMKDSVHKSISLPQIAAYVNLSVPHYTALFKKTSGMSPISYFISLKIQKASEYLKYSDFLVKEISFKVGIFDVQYFSRLFTKTTGLSPLKFRAQFKTLQSN
ncbi:AraC family transcriptional regulator [Pelobium manganitolerans]|uniref:AraC family transcriptional regulator n=1 Tax=Pelobium manganitolerans TaxID=1842495 RepID=UPI003FA3B35B